MPKRSRHTSKNKRRTIQRRKNRNKSRKASKRGGGKYNYSLYATFPNNVADAVKTTSEELQMELQNEYGNVLKWETKYNYDPPHITIAYGPSIDEDEVLTKEGIDKVYPGIMKLKSEGLPKIKYEGVDYFNNPDKYIIKVHWQSDMVNTITKHIMDNVPEMNERFKEYAASDGYGTNIKEYINNRNHSTLCVLDKAKVNEEQLNNIIKKAKELYESKSAPEEFNAESITLISAITDTPVPLW